MKKKTEIKTEFEKNIKRIFQMDIAVYTNTFMKKKVLECKIYDNESTIYIGEEYAAIIYKEDKTAKMYYIATLSGIKQLLEIVVNTKREESVFIEILGQEKGVKEQANLFDELNIKRLGIYNRWKGEKIIEISDKYTMGIKIKKATMLDYIYIVKLIYSVFDKQMDHLPTKNELEQLIHQELVYMLTYDEKEIGVTCLKKIKEKYYYIYLEALEKKYINSGIGIIFLQKIFKMLGECKYVSWTNSFNKRSIHMHEQFGFKKDGFVNYIYIV